MPRIRSLKPEAFQSETLAAVSLAAERTFKGLSTLADDRGRHSDKPAVINGALWAVRSERVPHTSKELEAELDELVTEGALCRYLGCDGRPYLHFVTWDDHQRVDRPGKSRLPRCPMHGREDYCGKHEGACPTREVSRDSREGASNTRDGVDGVHRDLDAGSSTYDLGTRTAETSSSATASHDQESGEAEDEDQDDGAQDRHDLSPELAAAIDRLCTHLAERVVANGSKPPTVGKKWRDAARLMMTADGRTEEQIHRAIDWCQTDDFWRSNVMSMPKLRQQYDQLRLRAQSRASPRGRQPITPVTSPRDRWMEER